MSGKLSVLVFGCLILLCGSVATGFGQNAPPPAPPRHDPAAMPRIDAGVRTLLQLMEREGSKVPADVLELARRYDLLSRHAYMEGQTQDCLRYLDIAAEVLRNPAQAGRYQPPPPPPPPPPGMAPPPGAQPVPPLAQGQSQVPPPGAGVPGAPAMGAPSGGKAPPEPRPDKALLAPPVENTGRRLTSCLDEPARLQDPFGIHPLRVEGEEPFRYARELGVHWHREGLYMFWSLVQPDPKVPAYDWEPVDELVASVPPEICQVWNIAAVIPPLLSRDSAYAKAHTYAPLDKESYAAFVRAAVERYNGDGVNDMPGLRSPIKFWQVENEPSAQDPAGFAELVRLSYQAIKSADPEAQVLLGGATGFGPVDNYLREFDQRFLPLIQAMGGRYFDIFDFHYYGNASGEYQGYREIVEHVRKSLAANGLPRDVEIWVTETATYTDQPRSAPDRTFAEQSEAQQAADLLKRHVLALAAGVKKVFWCWGVVDGFMNDNGFFDFTGLIRKDGRKKLAFHTYGLMTEKLRHADLERIALVQAQDGFHLYKVPRTHGSVVYVAWHDGTPGTVSLPVEQLGGLQRVLLTPALANASGAVASARLRAKQGALQLDLSQGPVFLEDGN